MITIQCIKGKKLFFSLPESELQKAIPDITHTNTHTVSLLLYCSLTLLKRSICQCCRFCLCCSQVSLIVQLTETINLSVNAAGSASAALRSALSCSLQRGRASTLCGLDGGSMQELSKSCKQVLVKKRSVKPHHHEFWLGWKWIMRANHVSGTSGRGIGKKPMAMHYR